MTMWTELAGLPFKQTFYDAKGIRTRVIEAGEGEPFIFIHGTGGHAETFLRNFKAHAAKMRVISIDAIGHGYTDAPDIEYSMEVLIEHIANLVDAMGLKQVSMGGVSMGGMLSCWYAIKYPERVKKITLVTGMLMTRTDQGKGDLQDALKRTARATSELSRDAVRARLAWLMHEPGKSVTDELVDVRQAIYAQPGRGAVLQRIADVVVGGVIDDAWAKKWSNPEAMRAIKCPTLVVWTRHNPGLTAERAAEGMKCIPDARMVVLENSGHWPHWEEPEEFDRHNIAFLTGK